MTNMIIYIYGKLFEEYCYDKINIFKQPILLFLYDNGGYWKYTYRQQENKYW